MTIGSLFVASRFNGPLDSGNGGYVCGLVAAQLGTTAPVAVTLRRYRLHLDAGPVADRCRR